METRLERLRLETPVLERHNTILETNEETAAEVSVASTGDDQSTTDTEVSDEADTCDHIISGGFFGEGGERFTLQQLLIANLADLASEPIA